MAKIPYKKMSDLGEFGFIDWLGKTFPAGTGVRQGIGDDTAVLPWTKKEDLLFTTDMSVEDVHFERNTPPELVGRKALARNLSDIAAMGGEPTFAVVSLGVPPERDAKWVKGVYAGMRRLAREFGVNIVGGDTVKSAGGILNVALLGKVDKGRAILRKGARPGDLIFVTGPLGGSLRSCRHLKFTPRIKEARWLVKHCRVTSMIDISDGLSADLGHVLKESSVGAVIFEEFIPLNKGARLQNALCDGEDFELLFTLSPKEARSLTAGPGTPFRLYHLGEIIKDAGQLFLVDSSHQRQLLVLEGFRHF